MPVRLPTRVAKPVDWSAGQNAFADIAVNGSSFTVTIYGQSGASLFSKTFTDGGPSVTPTASPAPTAAATTHTVSYRSTAAFDGQLLELSETSGVGGTLNAAGATFNLGDDASNRQYRADLSFNTAGLPDNATILSVILKICKAGGSSISPYATLGNIMVDVRTGPFSGNPALQIGDFQATASKNSVLSIPNAAGRGLVFQGPERNLLRLYQQDGHNTVPPAFLGRR